MTAEAAAAMPVGENTIEPAARRRPWRWIVPLVVIVVVVAGVAVWAVFGRSHRSAEEVARDDLQSAQLELVNAPGAHYTGRMTVKDGKTVGVDLRVTSVGEVSGSLEYAPGAALTYLRVGTKTFLQGSREGWIAYGFSPESASASEGMQLLEPSAFGDVDLATVLTPANLAERLDANAEDGKPVHIGDSEKYGPGATVVVSGAVTTVVRSGHVDRITDQTFDIRLEPMNGEEAARFYADLRPTVSALDLASDTESRVEFESGWSTPCATTCSAVATLTATPHPFVSISYPGYTPPVSTTFVAYEFALTINGVLTPRPDCTGILEMPGNGTATLSCAFTAAPGSQINAHTSTRPVLGRARADALLTALTEDAARTQAKSSCPVTRIHGSITTSKSGC